MQDLRQRAHDWLLDAVRQAYPLASIQAEITPPDARLRLGACAHLEFFLPAGARLWSNGALGARCRQPAPWSLYLSYALRLQGPALVAARALPASHPLGEGDTRLDVVHYAHEPGLYFSEAPASAMLARPLAAGQAILPHDLRLPNIIEAGARVKVRVEGPGFSVSQEGVAQNAARQGDNVRVKMPNGRVVQGRATAAGDVLISGGAP